MLARLKRLLRHRWQADAHAIVPAATLQRLTQRVGASERRHSGEIRICIESGLPLRDLWSDQASAALSRQRALVLFSQLRVWDTEHNNGVLIYLLLAERRIEIVADRGLNRKVPAATWQAIAARMRDPLRTGDFEAGLAQAVDEIDALLCTHTPLRPGEANPDELPDTPVVD